MIDLTIGDCSIDGLMNRHALSSKPLSEKSHFFSHYFK